MIKTEYQPIRRIIVIDDISIRIQIHRVIIRENDDLESDHHLYYYEYIIMDENPTSLMKLAIERCFYSDIAEPTT